MCSCSSVLNEYVSGALDWSVSGHKGISVSREWNELFHSCGVLVNRWVVLRDKNSVLIAQGRETTPTPCLFNQLCL